MRSAEANGRDEGPTVGGAATRLRVDHPLAAAAWAPLLESGVQHSLLSGLLLGIATQTAFPRGADNADRYVSD